MFSFNSTRFTVWEGFSFAGIGLRSAIRNLAEGPLNSLVIAIVATVFSTIIGTLAAYGLWKRRDA